MSQPSCFCWSRAAAPTPGCMCVGAEGSHRGSQYCPLLGSGLSCSRVTLLCPSTPCLCVCALFPSKTHPWGQDSHEQTGTPDSPPLTVVPSSPHCPSSLMVLFAKHILMLLPLLVTLPRSALLRYHCSQAVSTHLLQGAALPYLPANAHLPCPAFPVSLYQMFCAFCFLHY